VTGKVAVIRTGEDGTGRADVAGQRTACPLRDSCTTSNSGRTVTVHARDDLLQAHRTAQADPNWQTDYTGTRPKRYMAARRAWMLLSRSASR